MMLKPLLIMLQAFSILIIMGCSNSTIKETNDFPPSMTGMVISNGIEHQMEEGSYRWERKSGMKNVVVQTDHASPYQMAEDMNPLVLNPNQKVTFKIVENPDIKVFLWNETGREREIKHDHNQIVTPSKKGKYIYEVLATWKNGTVSYTFVAEIP